MAAGRDLGADRWAVQGDGAAQRCWCQHFHLHSNHVVLFMQLLMLNKYLTPGRHSSWRKFNLKVISDDPQTYLDILHQVLLNYFISLDFHFPPDHRVLCMLQAHCEMISLALLLTYPAGRAPAQA